MSSPTRSYQDYHMAWIAALPIERSAASEMLDETHEQPQDFHRNASDDNSYDWGRIHGHNIVIASLPAASYGKVNAAHTVSELLASMPHIKFGLLVGIGAGIPSAQHDIRLGDVVVSQPEGSHGGVVQYDLGKATETGWEQKGNLNSPPPILLAALANLQSKHESGHFRLNEFLSASMKRNKYWAKKYCRPAETSTSRSTSKRMPREARVKTYPNQGQLIQQPRESTGPCIHFGTIASGDTLVKDSAIRDGIPEKIRQTCLCIEMEAAGLMNKFPCLVIRGICDFADRHKNDDWQRYAAATSAAFAKELLLYVPIVELGHSRTATEIMELSKAVRQLNDNVVNNRDERRAQKVSALLQALYTCPYEERKDRNIEALQGTCQWFMQHDRFQHWLAEPDAKLLWVSADPGCGKSVLAKYLIDKVLNEENNTTACYFFFKDDFEDQRRSSHAMSAVLRQLLSKQPKLLSDDMLQRHAADGKEYSSSFATLWNDFNRIVAHDEARPIICVFDALDECQHDDRRSFIRAITEWHKEGHTDRLKILVTSRPYFDIKDEFASLLELYPTLHLGGENDAEAEEISGQIDIVLKHRIHLLSKKRSLTSQEEAYLLEKFISTPHRTYLWAHLALEIIEATPGLTRGHMQNVLKYLPVSVEDAYEKILNRSPDHTRTRILLQILIAAERPLLVEEVSIALSITPEQANFDQLDDVVEPVHRFRQSLRDLCGLFVIIVDARVYFLHQTAREFLLGLAAMGNTNKCLVTSTQLSTGSGCRAWARSLAISGCHQVLAEKCLLFLDLTKVARYNDSFFDYCNKYWPLHCRHAEFLETSSGIRRALRICQSWPSEYKDLPLWVCMFHELEHKKHQLPSIAYAAYFGITMLVKLMLDETPDNEMERENMAIALWFAVDRHRISTIELLVLRGVSLDTSPPRILDYKLPTSLWLAVSRRHTSVVKFLLDHGADVQHLDQRGQTIIHHMLEYKREKGDTALLELLTSYGASPTKRALHGNAPVHTFLRHFCRHGCYDDPETQKILQLLWIPGPGIDDYDSGIGGTLMQVAARGCGYTCMRALSTLGASAQGLDQWGNTPLHLHGGSSCNGDAIDFIIAQGVDVNARNSTGQSALMAVIEGRIEGCHGIKALIEQGADIEAKDMHGRTPLMYAVLYEVPNINRLQNMEDESHKESWLGPPSYLAYHPGWHIREQVRTLLDYGANVNARDNEGRSCAHFTATYAHPELLEQLLTAGLDIMVQDNAGCTGMDVLLNNCPDSLDKSIMQENIRRLETFLISEPCSADRGTELLTEFERGWEESVILFNKPLQPGLLLTRAEMDSREKWIISLSLLCRKSEELCITKMSTGIPKKSEAPKTRKRKAPQIENKDGSLSNDKPESQSRPRSSSRLSSAKRASRKT